MTIKLSTHDLSIPSIFIICGGVLLLAVAANHHWNEILALNQRLGPTVAFVLDGVLAMAVIGAGYWLSTVSIDLQGQWTVWWWTLAGAILFGSITSLTIAIRLYEGRIVSEPAFPLLIGIEIGALAGLFAGFNTVQARKQARRARRANEQLEALNQEIEASNDRLERFASILAHDLQEPLRTVSNYVQLLEQRYADELDDEAQDFIDYAVDGASRMEAMIDGVLEYARVSTSERSPEPVDVEELIGAVLDDLHFRVEETDAKVTTESLPVVKADRAQLAQVFRNLIENALRYSGDDPPRVHVSAESTDGEWQFAVHDEGVGIDPADQDRIFEMFEQRAEEQSQNESVGLGLALCNQIIQDHGGEIWVESEPGVGTTISFTIPRVDEMSVED